MAIKNKKTGTLARKRDFIEIYAKIKELSPLGGYTTTDSKLIYSNYADVKRMNQFWVNQYGFSANDVVYEIFINPTALTINAPDFNSDFNLDFLTAMEVMGINVNPQAFKGTTGDFNTDYNGDYAKIMFEDAVKGRDAYILWRGKELKISIIQDIDDNLGEKIRIVAQVKQA